MNELIRIRRASEKDMKFLTGAIIEAEKSGTGKLSYSTIFGLDENAVEKFLCNILEEDITGQELCINGFLIAEVEHEYAGAICGWVEGMEGMPSAMLKASAISHFIGKDSLSRAAAFAPLLAKLHIDREPGALQIESVYTCNKFRGMGVSGRLIETHINEAKEKFQEVSKVQILLAKTNDSAYRAYLKQGFNTVLEKHCDDHAVLDLLPSDTMILMEKII